MAPAANGGMTAPPPAGDWGTADPAMPGEFATTTEMMVGPGNSYTMVRPMMLTKRHPVITWGNGTGTTPPTYRAQLELYASHGFIVIASNSMNVAQGTPPPMLDGVTWVLEQDMTSGSALFEKVDREHIGATGHSQGAFAASSAGGDERIKTIAPIQSLGARRGLHGPALGLCGTMDTVVPCSGNLSSYMAISDQPVMYAELKAADHTNWIFSPGGAHPYSVITNAWFRVHLMGDTALRPLFYGADCKYCSDDAWVIMRKMMD
jgi:predicted dienelactone hydrolase